MPTAHPPVHAALPHTVPCRGREFYRPQPDLEIGSAEAEAAPASSSPRAGPLVAVGRFMRAAGRALQEEAEAEAATADCCTAISPCRPPLHYSSWALHTAERVMPGPLAHAAAVALASLSVRQLLRPKGASGPSLGVAAALWVNAAALFAAGCAAGVLLLARFLISGIRLLCVANQLVAHMLGLASECSTSPGPVPRWILGAGCFSACCVVWEVGRSSRPRPWALLLRLERHAPRLLLQLYAVAFLLAANMLLLVGWLAGGRRGEWWVGDNEMHTSWSRAASEVQRSPSSPAPPPTPAAACRPSSSTRQPPLPHGSR